MQIFSESNNEEIAVANEAFAASVLGEEQKETVISHDDRSDEQSVWEMIARWSVFLVALVTPLWFLPLTISPVDGNKMFLVSVLVIVGFVAWLGMAVYMSVLRMPRSLVVYALGLWILVYFLASIFSVSRGVSFWGTSATSFFHILIGALVACMTAVILRTIEDTRRVYMFVLMATAVAALFMVVQSIFSIDIFQWNFAKIRTFHPIGQWNAVGIFFGFILVSLMPFCVRGNSTRTRIYMIMLAIVSFILTAIVNFQFIWIGIALISVIYFAYYYSRPGDRGARMRYTTWPFVFLVVSILMYLSHDMVGTLTSDINPPLDITPSISSSLQIARDTLQENTMFGVGPNLFGYAWDQFKDPAVNTTVFWRLRFGTASSFATTLLTTTGALGALTFLFFVVSIIWTGFSVLRKLHGEESEHRFIGAIFFSLLFLLYTWFIYPLTIVISVMTFLMLGLFIAEARAAKLLSFSKISIRADSVGGFVTALVIIFLMVFGVVGLYITSQKYVAAVIYGRGVMAFDERDSVNEAESYFRRAVEFDGSRDQYYRAITQMSTIKLRRSLENAQNQPPEDVRSAFQTALSSAISAAQSATQVNNGNAVNWRLLGQVYESVIPFVGGSADAAIEAYKQAVERSPIDPVLRDDLARVYIALGDHVNARESLEEAIRLKPDYATAHFRLAQIAAIKGNVDDAIVNTERAALAAPNDIGILFQLGLLYYQQDRYSDAQQVLERAVSLNSNYSNARYFLGLVYAAQGEYNLAIEQFTFIRNLNPDNAEVEAILTNLKAERDPLNEISPAPLNRGQVPVEKEGEELNQDDVLQQDTPVTDEGGGEFIDEASTGADE